MPAIAPGFPVISRSNGERATETHSIVRMTLAEYAAFTREAEDKYELVDGAVTCMSGASPEHNQISANTLFAFLLIFRSAGIAVRVFGSDQKVYVDDRTNLYPDISIVGEDAQFDNQDALHNPTAVIEILSATTAALDQGRKFEAYRRLASLEHYVLIDQYRIAVAHHAKSSEGEWLPAESYTHPEELLTLTIKGKEISVSLASIYYLVDSAL